MLKKLKLQDYVLLAGGAAALVFVFNYWSGDRDNAEVKTEPSTQEQIDPATEPERPSP